VSSQHQEEADSVDAHPIVDPEGRDPGDPDAELKIGVRRIEVRDEMERENECQERNDQGEGTNGANVIAVIKEQ
jgi:hypothetical protein